LCEPPSCQRSSTQSTHVLVHSLSFTHTHTHTHARMHYPVLALCLLPVACHVVSQCAAPRCVQNPAMLAAQRGFHDVVLVLDLYVLRGTAVGPMYGGGGALHSALHSAVPFFAASSEVLPNDRKASLTSESSGSGGAVGGACGAGGGAPSLVGGASAGVGDASAGALVSAASTPSSTPSSAAPAGGGSAAPAGGGSAGAADFSAWLTDLGLGKYVAGLLTLGFDTFASALLLEEADLDEVSMARGHKRCAERPL
jgi:hypothetical protein